MRHDLVIDFETFGQNQVTCPIINCSAYTFDWGRFQEKPYSFEELLENITTFKVDVKDQVNNYGQVVEMETVNFWEKQEASVRKQAMPTKNDLSLEKFCNEFLKYLTKQPKIEYWWSRNNGYDPIIIWNAFRKAGNKMLLDEYIRFWRLRDTKTYIDAKFDFDQDNSFVPVQDTTYWEKTFKKHDSAHDVAADILRLQTIYRAENDLEITKK